MPKLISGKFDFPQLQGGVAALAFIGLISVAASPAYADPRWDRGRGHDRGWHRHEVYAHRYWHGPHYVEEEPRVVYAPPVVYEAPPIEEPSGINLVFPIHIH